MSESTLLERQAKRQAAVAEINKKTGKGERLILGTPEQVYGSYPPLPFGILGLDDLLGGGVPRGGCTQIYGVEGAGKTTLTYHLMARTQLDGGFVLFIDAERTFKYQLEVAENIGVQFDEDKLLVIAPDDAEQAISVCVKLLAAGVVDLIVLDSASFFVPTAEIDREVEKSALVALVARKMGEFVRRLVGPLDTKGCALVIVNHLVTTMKTDFHGNEITVPGGGRKLQNASALKLRVARKNKPDEVEKGELPESIGVTVTLDKSKVGTPFTSVELSLRFGEGFDVLDDLVSHALRYDAIKQSGAWYTLPGGERVQGRDKLLELVRASPEIIIKIKEFFNII